MGAGDFLLSFEHFRVRRSFWRTRLVECEGVFRFNVLNTIKMNRLRLDITISNRNVCLSVTRQTERDFKNRLSQAVIDASNTLSRF